MRFESARNTFARFLAGCIVAGIVAGIAATARAQSFNVDFFGSDAATIPSPAFGGAAGQPGHWNAFNCPDNCDGVWSTFLDLSGAPTPVGFSFLLCDGSASCSSGLPSGDFAALMGDGMRFDNTVLSGQFGHLAPGTYDLYVYASTRCASPGTTWLITHSNPATTRQENRISTEATAVFVEEGNYGRFRVRVDATGNLTVSVIGSPGLLVHGLQLVARTDPIQPICFGTNDSVTSCPCAGVTGTSGWERGCPSSSHALGARLTGTGASQVSADSLQLVVEDVPNSPLLLFQGTALHLVTTGLGGLGERFGDGLRCAGGTVVRIVVRTASGNGWVYPMSGDAPISVVGAVPAGGGLRVYQAWYRDAASFCTPATFNLSNGLTVDWSI